MQCFKCRELGHIAARCDKEVKCPLCAGNHPRKECKATDRHCANCGGNHGANFAGCCKIVEQREASEAKSLSYSDALKRGGELLECGRLACTLASALATVLVERAGLRIDPMVICKDIAAIVSRCFKVTIPTGYVCNSWTKGKSSTDQAAGLSTDL